MIPQNVTLVDELMDLDNYNDSSTYGSNDPKYRKVIRSDVKSIPYNEPMDPRRAQIRPRQPNMENPHSVRHPQSHPSHPSHPNPQNIASKMNNSENSNSTPRIHCIDICNHIKNCPICSKFYRNDKTALYVIVFILIIICILLFKKVLSD